MLGHTSFRHNYSCYCEELCRVHIGRRPLERYVSIHSYIYRPTFAEPLWALV